jgi:hypothetical protein
LFKDRCSLGEGVNVRGVHVFVSVPVASAAHTKIKRRQHFHGFLTVLVPVASAAHTYGVHNVAVW